MDLLFLAALFSHAGEAALNPEGIIIFLKIICIFYPTVTFGVIAASTFQGTGKGFHSFFITIWRTVILIPPLAFLFATTLNLGLIGIWWSMVVVNIIGSLTGFTWAKLYIHKLKTQQKIAE